MKRKILDMSGIKKYIFDISGKPIRGTDVLILDDVWFDLYEGEVNVLLGENGAGKSTLMKILAGEIPHDAGKMMIQGEELHFGNPRRRAPRALPSSIRNSISAPTSPWLKTSSWARSTRAQGWSIPRA